MPGSPTNLMNPAARRAARSRSRSRSRSRRHARGMELTHRVPAQMSGARAELLMSIAAERAAAAKPTFGALPGNAIISNARKAALGLKGGRRTQRNRR